MIHNPIRISPPSSNLHSLVLPRLWKSVRDGKQSGVFTCMRAAWQKLHGYVQFKWGLDHSVRYWKDICSGPTPLCNPFPDIFSIPNHKDVIANECYGHVPNQVVWDKNLALEH